MLCYSFIALVVVFQVVAQTENQTEPQEVEQNVVPPIQEGFGSEDSGLEIEATVQTLIADLIPQDEPKKTTNWFQDAQNKLSESFSKYRNTLIYVGLIGTALTAVFGAANWAINNYWKTDDGTLATLHWPSEILINTETEEAIPDEVITAAADDIDSNLIMIITLIVLIIVIIAIYIYYEIFVRRDAEDGDFDDGGTVEKSKEVAVNKKDSKKKEMPTT